MPNAAYQYIFHPAVICCCTDCSKIVKQLINEDPESKNNNSNKKLKEDLDKMMENLKMTDKYKFIAGNSQKNMTKIEEIGRQ